MADSLSAAGVDPHAMMAQVRQEVAEAQLQDLVETMSDKCFKACVKPSGALTSGEQACISKCVDRYRDAMTVIYKSVARAASQR